MLCDLLEATGVTGKPHSFYRRQSIPNWVERLGVPAPEGYEDRAFDRRYLDAVLKAGNNGTGIFGLRLMWPSVAELSERLERLFPGLPDDRARFEKAFGNPLYLHLSRQDRIAQAVSRFRAEQTGLWHLASDGTERERTAPHRKPVYDAEQIAAFVAEAEDHNNQWINWFARHGIAPLSLTYEGVAADPGGSLASILSALGLDLSIAATTTPKTAKMADGESLEWIERFRRSS